MRNRIELGHGDALRLVQHVQAALESRGWGAAVAVVDAHGELLAFLRADGCRLPSVTIAINKAFTAAREQVESLALGEASRRDQFPMTNFGELRYVSWGGGVPLVVGGEVVGGIGVSGLPEADDLELARAAAALLDPGPA